MHIALTALLAVSLQQVPAAPGMDTLTLAPVSVVVALPPAFPAWRPSLEPDPELAAVPAPAILDTGRTKPIEYSRGYEVRASIHRYASYATVPLVVTEYFLGQHLFNNPGLQGGTRSAHAAVAAGIGVLFGVNTITGVWNLWDSRRDPAGRTRRWLHSGLMLVADAGFAWAASIAPGQREALSPAFDDRRRKHRTVALGSMGVSLASYAMMLIWKE
jgi:hypothetical protein